MRKISFILLLIVYYINQPLAQSIPLKKFSFSMQCAAGYSNYAKSLEGVFLSTDFRFSLYKSVGILNNLTMANGREKSTTYRPNFQFVGWEIGPDIQIRLIKINNLQIASGMCISWFIDSKSIGELQHNNSSYPLVIETSTYNIGCFASLGYSVDISQRVSVGLKYCISSMSKVKGHINIAGVICQIKL
jgi:hypothetical protein